jgi:hypothetical protein
MLVTRLPIAALLLLCACVTSAENEAARITIEMRDSGQQAAACLAPIWANPRYSHLYSKVAVGFKNGALRVPSAAELSDPEAVTDDDIAAILDWYSEIEPCARASIEREGRIAPELGISEIHDLDQNAASLDKVVRERPTYGTINAMVIARRQRRQAEIQQAMQGIRARLQAQYQDEMRAHEALQLLAVEAIDAIAILATRQMALEHAQRTYAAAHPSYRPVARITTTTCEGFGGLWSCRQVVSAASR